MSRSISVREKAALVTHCLLRALKRRLNKTRANQEPSAFKGACSLGTGVLSALVSSCACTAGPHSHPARWARLTPLVPPILLRAPAEFHLHEELFREHSFSRCSHHPPRAGLSFFVHANKCRFAQEILETASISCSLPDFAQPQGWNKLRAWIT